MLSPLFRTLGLISILTASLYAATSIPKDASDEVLNEKFQEAVKMIDGDEVRQGIDLLNRIIELKPEAENAWFARAHARARLNEGSAARADVSQSLKIFPDNPAALAFRARLSYAEKDMDSALEDLDRAVELESEEMEYRLMRAEVRKELEDYSGALDDVNLVIESDEHLSTAYLLRAAIREKRDEVADARLDYTKVIELAPEAPDGYRGRGWIEFNAGNWDAAARDGEKLVTLEEPDLRDYRLAGYGHFGAGRYRESIDWLGRDQGKPGEEVGYSTAYALFVRHYAQLRLNGKADDRVAKAMATWPADSWLRAIARFILGEIDEAALRQASLKADSDYEKRGQTCEMHFYIGLARAQAGDRSTAQVRFEACRATEMTTFTEYALAAAELAR